jgi:signal transduction histidine kinase
MSNNVQTPANILRIYLVPYVLLLILFFLMIGGGGSWLYLSARHAQTELVTTHILDVIRPTIKQLEEEQGQNVKQQGLSKLSEKVVRLYHALPYLRQISIRNRNKGYGVRLASNKQLVDVELEPLSPNQISQANHQALAHHLHHNDGPFFHVLFDLSATNNELVQVDIAFDRIGLVEQIETSMQSLIHSIVIFSSLCLVSLLLAFALSVYISQASHKMSARLQIIYQQAKMGKLSADLVHDLRNPLASIRANIKNLLITPEQTDQVVAEMDQDLMRLEHKLTDFLKLTRPRNDDYTVVDLNVFLQDIARQCNPLFKQKQQSLTVNIAPDIEKLPVMAESLTDALINLLANARNNTPEQGHIKLQARSIGTQVEIVIKDDGPGINADVLPRIFEPFFTTRTDGHGLGLAIVKRIIKAHNGTVCALNCPEGGARFTIMLPVKQQNE